MAYLFYFFLICSILFCSKEETEDLDNSQVYIQNIHVKNVDSGQKISLEYEKEKWKKKKLKIVIYFIRHALSKTNVKYSKDFITNCLKNDTLLSKKGIDQTLELKKKIENNEIKRLPQTYDIVISSSLFRAQKTALLLFAPEHKVYVLPFLREDRIYNGNFPPKVNMGFRNIKYSISKQKKKFKNKKLKEKLDYCWVENQKNKDVFTENSIKSDINKFLKFLSDNLEDLIPKVKTSKKEDVIKIAVVTHSYFLKKGLLNNDKDSKKPHNLGIFKWEGTYDKQKDTIIHNKLKTFSSFHSGSNVIFRGYPKYVNNIS